MVLILTLLMITGGLFTTNVMAATEPDPSIEIEKTGDNLSKAGDSVDYTFVISNTGNIDLERDSVEDDVIGDISSEFPEVLDYGEEATVNISHEVPEGSGDSLTNKVEAIYSVDGNGDSSSTVSASDTHTVELFTAGVSVTKEADTDQAQVGDEVDYTITVTNDSSDNAPLLEGTVTDDMLGLNENFSLDYGEEAVYNESYTITEDDPNPFINTAEVTASPDGFSNEYTAEDSWTIELISEPIVSETAWAAHDVGVNRYTPRGNWATYLVYDELNGSADIYAGQDIYVGSVSFDEISGDNVEITVQLEGWEFEPDTTNLYVQDYNSSPGGNPAPGRFDYKEMESGNEATITVPLNNYYGIHLNVYEVN